MAGSQEVSVGVNTVQYPVVFCPRGLLPSGCLYEDRTPFVVSIYLL